MWVVAGVGEAARRRPRRQLFLLAQARALVGTVFVDAGDDASETLYQSMRPQPRKASSAPDTATAADADTAADTAAADVDTAADTAAAAADAHQRRQEALHAGFLRSHPETRWLLTPKRGESGAGDGGGGEGGSGGGGGGEGGAGEGLEGADAAGTAPAPFAALVAAFTATQLARLLTDPAPAPAADTATTSDAAAASDTAPAASDTSAAATDGRAPRGRQWVHLDALGLYRRPRDAAAAAAMVALEEVSFSSPAAAAAAAVGYSTLPDGYVPIPASGGSNSAAVEGGGGGGGGSGGGGGGGSGGGGGCGNGGGGGGGGGYEGIPTAEETAEDDAGDDIDVNIFAGVAIADDGGAGEASEEWGMIDGSTR